MVINKKVTRRAIITSGLNTQAICFQRRLPRKPTRIIGKRTSACLGQTGLLDHTTEKLYFIKNPGNHKAHQLTTLCRFAFIKHLPRQGPSNRMITLDKNSLNQGSPYLCNERWILKGRKNNPIP